MMLRLLIWTVLFTGSRVFAEPDVGQLVGGGNAGPFSLTGDSTSLMIGAGALGLFVVGIFGYLYWQEWRVKRVFRQYQEANAARGVPVAPVRENLVRRDKRSRLGSKPEGKVRLMVFPNNGMEKAAATAGKADRVVIAGRS